MANTEAPRHPHPLRIVVIGAGLGGLATAIALAREGHQVKVFERHNGLSEYGAGLQCTPNAVQVLSHLGLRAAFETIAFAPTASIARRYKTGEVLGETPQNPGMEKIYGFPYWNIFRPDYQRILAEGAAQHGVTIEYNSQVDHLNPLTGSMELHDGRKESADLVVCADGVGSRLRKFITDSNESPVHALPESNYRVVIPAEKMLAHAETAELLQSNNTQAFLGPGAAIICYPISQGKLYNLAILSTSEIEKGSGNEHVGKWDRPVDRESFQALFADFSPLGQQLINLADDVVGWQIGEVLPLPTWHKGCAVLLGDAAHSMSPHAAQGSAMAIEDGAILAQCLRDVVDVEHDLPSAFEAYENSRRPRVERIAVIAKNNGGLWTLPDGPEQTKRDENFKKATAAQQNLSKEDEDAQIQEKTAVQGDPDAPWPSAALMKWIYGFDAFTATA